MSADPKLVDLLHLLRLHDYRFTTVTPATHSTVAARPSSGKADLRDIFGWNREFGRDDLEPAVLSLLEQADALDVLDAGLLRSRVRVASLGDALFVHSAFPTDAEDAVFFGPDTYRFARFVAEHIAGCRPPTHLVDMGTGSGAGGIATARRLQDPVITLVDVNGKALDYAKVNAAAAGVPVETVQSDRVSDDFDVLIGNAPYLMDTARRAYRDGGDLFGGGVTLDWVRQGLARLRPERTVLLYTGAAYVDGRAPLLDAIADECRTSEASLVIDEIDPDVFGDELLQPDYEKVERISAVGIRIGLPQSSSS